MDKESRFPLRWHKERLPVAAAIFTCILLEFLFAAYAEITRSSFFMWPMLGVWIVSMVLAMVVLPRVISKEHAQEQKQQTGK